MIRTLAVVALFGWSNVAAAQPDSGARAPEEPTPPPPEGTPPPAEPETTSAAIAPMPPPIPAPTPEPERKGKKISVLWAPFRLIDPVVEFIVEYRVMKKLGVSVTIGAGKRTIGGQNEGIFGGTNTAEVTGTEIEGGAQVRYYLVGSFDHGMEVGAESLYERVKFEEPSSGGIRPAPVGGLTVGPFLGYKIATRSGFTFEVQAGARYLAAEPKAYTSGPVEVQEKKWLPIAHVNVGWSF